MVDRILLVLKIKNLTPSKFADEIGIQRSSMSHIMSGRNLPSLDLITKILNKYPDINSEWLMQGAGPILKTIPAIQIDLFEQQTEIKTTEIAEQKSEAQPEIKPVIEKKIDPPVEKTPEKAPEIIHAENKQPEIKQVEVKQPEIKPEIIQEQIKDTRPEASNEKKPEEQPEIEKIVIFYKNRTFKEYYPG